MTKWVTVSIPEVLKEEAEKMMEEGKLPYTNWADFARDSIRVRLRHFGADI